MKILILGASGYAGACIKEVLEKRFQYVFGTYKTRNDKYQDDKTMFQFILGDKEQLLEILNSNNPDIIISCLNGNFLQQIEAHKMAAKFLAEKESGRLVYLSTSNVFDGALETVHLESDKPKAVSEYGKFKIECEKLIQNLLGENYIIIRIPEIWGKDCPRLLKLIKDIKTKTPIQTYQNIFVNYTTNLQIAEWIVYILEQNLQGIFHIGTKDIYEYIEFQNELIRSLQLEKPIYTINNNTEKLFQAVLPGRKEIPEFMQRHVKDIIQYLVDNSSDNFMKY